MKGCAVAYSDNRPQPRICGRSNIEQAFKALCTELNAQGSINSSIIPNMMNRMELSNESTESGDIAPKFSLPDQDGEQVNLTTSRDSVFWFISTRKP